MEKTTLSLLCLLVSLAALVLSAVAGSFFSHWPLFWKISLGVGVVGTATFVVLELENLKKLFSKKTARYGLNSIVMGIVAVGIAVFANLIANRYDVKKDFTKDKLHSLSDQSIKIVQNLENEITIRPFVFPQQRAGWNLAFSKYTYHTKKLKIEYIDPDKDPQLVQQYKITRAGTLIIESNSRSSKLDNLFNGPDDPKFEEKITNAIIQVAKGQKRKIYFVKGHGEKRLDDRGAAGFSSIKESLESGRYEVAELLLIDQKAIPTDADIVVIAGPQTDFMDHEIKMLETYAKGGGNLMVLVDPDSTTTVKPLLTTFGASWTPKRVMIENSQFARLTGSPLAPIVTEYSTSHGITKETKEISVFNIATPMPKAKKLPEGIKVTELFSTRPTSAEVKLPKDGKIVLSPETLKNSGKKNLALAITGEIESTKEEKAKPKKDEAKKEEGPKKPNEYRVVIVGDSDFPSNRTSRIGINADLFQNMLSWLAKEEDLIALRPKATNESKLEITEARMTAVFWISVLLAPLLMLLSGTFVWLTRRKA